MSRWRTRKARLDKEKEQLLRLKADLATAKDQFTYAGRSYTAAEVRTDLAGRFDRYKTGEATLKSLRELAQRAAKEPGCRPRQARRDAGLAPPVAGRGRKPGGPLADVGRHEGHEQLPV